MAFPGSIGVMGGGSWATALAKLLLENCETIYWYMRRDDRIEDFVRTGYNPAYLSDVKFDVNRIIFSSDINWVCNECDTLLLAMPSPFIKNHLEKVNVDLSSKAIVSAIKGIVPDENMTVTAYMKETYGIDVEKLLVVSGPCHAEEVALSRPSYLTVGCSNTDHATAFASLIDGPNTHTTISVDVEGIEYAAVLKNIYAIAAGIIHGLKMGDNYIAMLVSNATREMARFLAAVAPDCNRHISDSVYLGDLLVTAYSRFSRNHNFGSLIGRGYSISAAKMEMEQVAEGYYGAYCIHQINKVVNADIPIIEGVYDIIYRRLNPAVVMKRLGTTFK